MVGVVIPPDFLNKNSYRVRLLVVENQNRVVFKMDDALFFELKDSPEWRDAYFGKRPGLVIPTFDWEIENLS